MPKVSICIPAYNQVIYLKKTLDSVMLQTFQDYEVIITDDTSGPMVKELIDQFDFGGKLYYFKNDAALGSPRNWNESIKKASGEYIKILHHDDWFKQQDSLEKYVNLLSGDPECGFAFSASHVLLNNGVNWNHQTSFHEVDEIRRCPASLFLGNKIGSPSAVIFRKDILESFDNNLKWLVDVEFYIRAIQKVKKIRYCSESLITTFGMEGRVSDFCLDNSHVEIFENFYLFDKIRSQLYLNLHYWAKCMRALLALCRKYKISTGREIRSFGYNGRIDWLLLVWLRF